MCRTFSGGIGLIRKVTRTFLAVAAMALAGNTSLHAAGAADDHTVLILSASVSGGASSVEAIEAAAAGFTVEVVDNAVWGAKTATEFHTYRALILGDPSCGSISAISAEAAVAQPVHWPTSSSSMPFFPLTRLRKSEILKLLKWPPTS